MQKVKVLHIVEDLRIGGIERVVETLVENLSSEKYILSVLCLCDGGEIYENLKEKNISINILNLRSGRDIRAFFGVVALIRKEKPQIVHTHGISANAIGRFAAVLAGTKKIISHVHTDKFDTRIKTKLKEMFLNVFTAKVLACSEAVKKVYMATYGSKDDLVTIVYNGVDIDKFKSDNTESFPRKKIVFACVASMTKHKGHIYLIEAVSILKQKSCDNFKLVMVGDGPERDSLESKCKDLSLLSEVRFLGRRNDVAQLLESFDVVVLPSADKEGLGISLIEAMAVSRPVIGTRLGGIIEVIDDGVDGLLVEPKDPGSLAEAMKFFVDKKDAVKIMGQQARLKVLDKFTMQKMISTVEAVYDE